MSPCIYRRILSWCKNSRNRSLAVVIVLLLGGTAFVLTVVDIKTNYTQVEQTIKRNDYGEGSRIEDLEVRVGNGEKKSIQVEVEEQQYTDAEIKQIFQQSTKQIEQWILGENASLNKIVKNMNLIKEIPGQPIDVEWELDRYDIMNVSGEIQETALDEKGVPVNLTAILTYRERPSEQMAFQCAIMVCPKELTAGEAQASKVIQLIKAQNETTKVKDKLFLPSRMQGKQLTYYQHVENRGVTLFVMAVLIGGLLLALEKQNKRKKEQQIKKQMLQDYSEIVSKMTLLLGAGMTVKNAWKKLVGDYEEQKGRRGKREVYEEMRITWHEMQSGVTESESYERFGRRCNIQAYRKLGALLSQNLRKGTKGLNELLKGEAIQAFEERKANAKRLGEEAGTKLLLPMFFMLGIVLVMVIVPAFLSIQM